MSKSNNGNIEIKITLFPYQFQIKKPMTVLKTHIHGQSEIVKLRSLIKDTIT